MRGAARPDAPRTVAVVALLALLGACTSAPTIRGDATAAADRPFSLSGRLSAKRGADGATANFDWDHTPAHDRIDLASPFGQIIARVDGVADRVVVERPGGATETYPDWRAMTLALLGAPVPMDDLAFWIVGEARAGAAASVERDVQGRAQVLRQQAWEIVYTYPDPSASKPSRVVLTYPDVDRVEVRIAVDRWN
jgi:outer membrane lipoprotein LolB